MKTRVKAAFRVIALLLALLMIVPANLVMATGVSDDYSVVGLGTLMDDKSSWVDRGMGAFFDLVQGESISFDGRENFIAYGKEHIKNDTVYSFQLQWGEPGDNWINNQWWDDALRMYFRSPTVHTISEWGEPAYVIWLGEEWIKLQKFEAGKSIDLINETVANDGIFELGKLHDLQVGILDVPGGTQTILMIDGEVIFNYLDVAGNGVYIPDSGYFGFFSWSQNKSLLLKDLDPDQPIPPPPPPPPPVIDLGALMDEKSSWVDRGMGAFFDFVPGESITFDGRENFIAYGKEHIRNNAYYAFQLQWGEQGDAWVNDQWWDDALRIYFRSPTVHTISEWGEPAYVVWLGEEWIRLQKFEAANSTSLIDLSVVNDGIFELGELYDVEVGILDVDGGTRTVLKIDGKVIIDYFDEEGSGNFIPASGYFGFFSWSQNKSLLLMDPSVLPPEPPPPPSVVNLGSLMDAKASWLDRGMGEFFDLVPGVSITFDGRENFLAYSKEHIRNDALYSFQIQWGEPGDDWLDHDWQSDSLDIYFRSNEVHPIASWGSDAYQVSLGKDHIWLQKYEGGNPDLIDLKIPNDGIFELGTLYDMQLGILDVPGGTQTILKINNKVIIDYFDDEADGGNFIPASGYFGFFAWDQSKTLLLMDPSVGGQPVIFNLSDEVRPGEAFHIFGDNLRESSGIQVFTEVDGQEVELKIVQYDTDDQNYSQTAIPGFPSTPGMYTRNYGIFIAVLLEGIDGSPIPAGVNKIWVENSFGQSSGTLWLNRATPYWLGSDVGYAGIEQQLVGVNFTATRFGAGSNNTAVRLVSDDDGTVYNASITTLEPYSIKFTTPDIPVGQYHIELTNNGTLWTRMENEQELFRVIPPGNDPFDLGVAWEAYYNYDTIINVKDPQIGVLAGATGDGVTDDTAAINAILNHMHANGGGILLFPEGNYLTGRLNIADYTILKGESRENTVLTFIGGRNNAGVGTVWFHSRNDAEGYNGFTNMTLRICDDSLLPHHLTWIWGNSWNSGFHPGNEGLFLKNLTTDFPREYRGFTAGANMFNISSVDKYFLIADTYQRGFGTLTAVMIGKYITIRNNDIKISYAGIDTNGSYVIIENNRVDLDKDFLQDPNVGINPGIHGESPVNGMFTRNQFYIAHNDIIDVGNRQTRMDGEVVCVESASGRVLWSIGTLNSSDGTTLTLNHRLNESIDSVIYDYNPSAGMRPYWGYLTVLITGGKGTGQYRRVVSNPDIGQPNDNVYEIDRPWDVEPDESSKFIIMALGRDGIMYSNNVVNGRAYMGPWGGTINLIIADNVGIDSYGLMNYTFHEDYFSLPGPGGGYITNPSFYTSFIGNEFTRPGVYSDTLTIEARVLWYGIERSWGLNQLGLSIKNNKLSDAPNSPNPAPNNTAPIAPNGISIQVIKTSDPPHPVFKAGIIEGNTLTNMLYGIFIGDYERPTATQFEAITGIVIKDNEYVNCTIDRYIGEASNVLIIGEEEDGDGGGGDFEPEGRPRIFRLSDEVKPGEAFHIYGYNLLEADGIEVWADIDGTNVMLEIIHYDADGSMATALLPADVTGGVYNIWVVDDEGNESDVLKLNLPKPNWVSWDITYEGIELQVIGSNFLASRFGGTGATAVRLRSTGNNTTYAATVTTAEPYSIKFDTPAMPVGPFTIEVSNDGGTTWVVMINDQKLNNIAKGNDPMGLGVAWEVNYVYDFIADVTDFGADPTGQANSTTAVRNAVAAVNSNGGGIVYFPEGTFMMNAGVSLGGKTIVQGAGPDKTRIIVPSFPVIPSWGDQGLFVSRYTDYNGVMGFTLDIEVDRNLQTLLWFGEGRPPVPHTGAFMKDLVVNMPMREAQRDFDLHSGFGVSHGLVENIVSTGFKSMPTFSGGDYTVIRNSEFDVIQAFTSDAQYMIFENNKVKMNADLGFNNPGFNLSTYNYVANNTFTNIDNAPVCAENREVYDREFAAAHKVFRVDGAGELEGRIITLADSPPIPQRPSFWNAGNKSWIAVITEGKGMGQYRKIVGVTVLNFTIDKAFDIWPDDTSTIVIATLDMDTVIYGNAIEDASGAINLTGGSINTIVADNTGLDSYGIMNRTNVATSGLTAKPSFFVSYINNEFNGGGAGNGHVSISSSVSYGMNNESSYGYSQYGLIIKGNRLANATGTTGVGGTVLDESGIIVQVARGGNTLPDGGLIKGVLIENNTFDNMNAGINVRVTPAVGEDAPASINNVVIKGNVFNNMDASITVSEGVSYTIIDSDPCAPGHTPGPEATCTAPQVCTVCDIELAPATGHTPGPKATCTAPQICTVCDYVLAPAFGHTPGDLQIALAPTRLKEGIWEIYCEVCNGLLETGAIQPLVITNAVTTPKDFIRIVETSKNSRVWALTFRAAVESRLEFEGVKFFASETVEYTIYLNGNNANLDGTFRFGAEHELSGYMLRYDIKGNGSNIKAFSLSKIVQTPAFLATRLLSA